MECQICGDTNDLCECFLAFKAALAAKDEKGALLYTPEQAYQAGVKAHDDHDSAQYAAMELAKLQNVAAGLHALTGAPLVGTPQQILEAKARAQAAIDRMTKPHPALAWAAEVSK